MNLDLDAIEHTCRCVGTCIDPLHPALGRMVAHAQWADLKAVAVANPFEEAT